MKRQIQNPPNMRRVMVAGRIKYIPVKDQQNDVVIVQENTQIKCKPLTNNKIIPKKSDADEEITMPVYKNTNMEINEPESDIPIKNKRQKDEKTKNLKKIPAKYAKQMEMDVKNQTIKSVKNFSDLRRVRAIQDIQPDPELDSNHASILELRKLRMQQRKREQIENQKRQQANKKDSAIQEILKNDNMSKFAKTVAIRNLSVSSRNKTNNPTLNE